LIHRAIDETNTSARSLSANLGIGLVHWWTWTRGYRDPDPRMQGRLAEALHLSPYSLMEAAGYLPLGTEAALLSPTTGRDSCHHDVGPRATGLDLVRAMASTSKPLPTVVAPVGRGTGHRRMPVFHEYVAFTSARTPRDERDRSHQRESLVALLGPAWQSTAASWEDSDELISAHLGSLYDDEALARTQVALVPRFLASTSRIGISDDALPKQIAVLGAHHSGAPDVGAHLAGRLGYSFDLLSNLAVACFGRKPRAERALYERHLANHLMSTAPLEGGGRVWAFNDIDAMRSFDPQLALSRGLAVAAVRRSPDLVRYNAVRGYLHDRSRGVDSALEEHLDRQDGIERTLERIVDGAAESDRVVYATVGVPSSLDAQALAAATTDDDLHGLCPDCVDEFFDLYLDAGDHIADAIRR
jgi:hypothetical protein